MHRQKINRSTAPHHIASTPGRAQRDFLNIPRPASIGRPEILKPRVRRQRALIESWIFSVEMNRRVVVRMLRNPSNVLMAFN